MPIPQSLFMLNGIAVTAEPKMSLILMKMARDLFPIIGVTEKMTMFEQFMLQRFKDNRWQGVRQVSLPEVKDLVKYLNANSEWAHRVVSSSTGKVIYE